jgi:hypothetical protein
MEAVEWLGIGVTVVVVLAVAGAFLNSWRKRGQKPPVPTRPYREWKD